MPHQDYFPKADAELTGWTNTFDTGLSDYGSTIGITATEIGDLNNATKSIRQAITTSNAAQAAAKQAVKDKDATIKAAETTIRAIVKRAKTSTAYTAAIGEAMNIIGSDTAQDWNAYKPVITADAFPGHVAIGFKKMGAQGVNIYTRLKGESAWHKLAFDGHSPYIDNRPSASPGTSENREYMAIGVLNDNETGQQSDIVSISFAG